MFICVYAPKHQSILYVTQAYIVKCNIILMRNQKITNETKNTKRKQKNLKTGKQNERQKKYATYVFTIIIDNCCIFFFCVL